MSGLDDLVCWIATRQHGVVARWQLLAAGVPAHWIERRLRKGWLIQVHRGVYRVGHAAPSVEADYMAAVLGCGDGAVLCGRAAGHLLRLTRSVSAPGPEVAAATRRSIPGVITHRVSLEADDIVGWRGIPVTTPARTLVDLAAVVSAGELARAVHVAGITHDTTPDEIEAALARRPKAPGTGKLRRVLHGDEPVLLSKLERRFMQLLRGARLPLPDTNHLAGGRLVDCRWPRHRLTVELDGYRYHRSRHAWEQDRLRERQAYARGDQFRRYTWDDVTMRPEVVIAEISPLLRHLDHSYGGPDAPAPRNRAVGRSV